MTEKLKLFDQSQKDRLLLIGVTQHQIALAALSHTGLRPSLERKLEATLGAVEQSSPSDKTRIRLRTIIPKEEDGQGVRDDVMLGLNIIVGDQEMFTPWQVAAAMALLDELDPDISG